MAKRPEATTEFLRALGKTIRTIRQERGMKQEQLGAAVGTAGSRIGEIERATTNPSTARIHAIAHAFGMSPVALLERVARAAQDAPSATVRAQIVRGLRGLPARDLELVAALVARLLRPAP